MVMKTKKITITSCQKLLERKIYSQLLEDLNTLCKTAQDQPTYQTILHLFRQIPNSELMRSFLGLKAYAHILASANQVESLEKLLVQVQHSLEKHRYAEIQLEYAMALQIPNRHEEAAQLFLALIPELQNATLGMAWVRLGWSLFELQQDWESAFATGLAILENLKLPKGQDNIELARGLINYGYCLSKSGQHEKAHQAWLNALKYVKHRVKTQAYILYNLAHSAQRLMQLQAEAYFLELERLSEKPKASAMKAAAFNGIGLYRRSLGEWSRAKFAYLMAIESTPDSTDLGVAYRGLARVHELSGNLQEAKKILTKALSNPQLIPEPLLIAKASVLLRQQDFDGTQETLKPVKEVPEVMRWTMAFIQAELARAKGQDTQALQHLTELPVDIFQVREEITRYPELKYLLEKHALPVPKPLLYSQGITVRIEATNVLIVYVNNRIVTVPPTGKVAGLLVFLLEHQRVASASDLEMNLFLESNNASNALNGAASTLRSLLGWAESIQYNKKTKQLKLDSSVTWQYDIAKARVKKRFIGEFLKGMKDPPDWVIRIREELEAFKPLPEP
jgi:tetratricopeptide (TPR) repeat protein